MVFIMKNYFVAFSFSMQCFLMQRQYIIGMVWNERFKRYQDVYKNIILLIVWIDSNSCSLVGLSWNCNKIFLNIYIYVIGFYTQITVATWTSGYFTYFTITGTFGFRVYILWEVTLIEIYMPEKTQGFRGVFGSKLFKLPQIYCQPFDKFISIKMWLLFA